MFFSFIYFSIHHIYATVRGDFPDFNGIVRFSPDDLASNCFNFNVAVKSIDTRENKRDIHLNSAEFFDSEKYPQRTFTSTAVKHVKDNHYLVEGKLTIEDVTQTVAVPFTFLGIRTNPFDDTTGVAGFEARMTIDRLSFHVGSGKFYNMGVVGKDVTVLITLEVTRKK